VNSKYHSESVHRSVNTCDLTFGCSARGFNKQLPGPTAHGVSEIDREVRAGS
jgi:hypothetical protein